MLMCMWENDAVLLCVTSVCWAPYRTVAVRGVVLRKQSATVFVALLKRYVIPDPCTVLRTSRP